MKNLKLLNKRILLIIIFFLHLSLGLQSQEPADIWSIETEKKTKNEIKTNKIEENNIPENTIYEMQTLNEEGSIIEENKYGETPLHVSVTTPKKNFKITELLVETGSDVHNKNNKGNTIFILLLQMLLPRIRYFPVFLLYL